MTPRSRPVAVPDPIPDAGALAGPSFPALARRSPNPIVVTLLGVIPGLGHLACGLPVRGLVFFLAVASLIALTTPDAAGEFLVVLAVFAWIFGIIDGARHAVLARQGRCRDLLFLGHLRGVPGLKAVGGGAVLLFVSLLAALRIWFGVDLASLARLWPAAVAAIGGLLVWAGVREQRLSRQRGGDGPTPSGADASQRSRGP